MGQTMNCTSLVASQPRGTQAPRPLASLVQLVAVTLAATQHNSPVAIPTPSRHFAAPCSAVDHFHRHHRDDGLSDSDKVLFPRLLETE